LVKVIRDIWIMTNFGTVLFSRVFNEEVDANLFGAMMSALNFFAEGLSKGGLSSFILKNKCFSILKLEECILIANYHKKSQEKKAQKELFLIGEKFLEKYSDDLVNFHGQINIFDKFKKEIDDSLEDIVEKMKEGFW